MTKMNKEEFINYRLDILENRIASIEKRIDSLMPINNNNNNINMELLQMVMSMVKEPKIETKVTCVKEIERRGSESPDDSKMDAFNLRRRSTII
jgi:uncharacterized protein YigA (DUF484 family)